MPGEQACVVTPEHSPMHQPQINTTAPGSQIAAQWFPNTPSSSRGILSSASSVQTPCSLQIYHDISRDLQASDVICLFFPPTDCALPLFMQGENAKGDPPLATAR